MEANLIDQILSCKKAALYEYIQKGLDIRSLKNIAMLRGDFEALIFLTENGILTNQDWTKETIHKMSDAWIDPEESYDCNY